MGYIISWRNASTGAKKRPVPKAIGITRISAPTKMKRAKVPDKAQENAHPPEDASKKGKGVTLTRLDRFRMNLKMRTIRTQ